MAEARLEARRHNRRRDRAGRIQIATIATSARRRYRRWRRRRRRAAAGGAATASAGGIRIIIDDYYYYWPWPWKQRRIPTTLLAAAVIPW